jgi:hypothetical protein
MQEFTSVKLDVLKYPVLQMHSFPEITEFADLQVKQLEEVQDAQDSKQGMQESLFSTREVLKKPTEQLH